MKIRNRWLIRLAGRCIARLLRALFVLVRADIKPAQPGTSPYEPTGEKFIYCIWHDGVLATIFGAKAIDCAGLVSRHEDGSYLADAMACVGVAPIRGSSRHGGAAAMKQMIDSAAHKHIAIATDGPRGPRRVVKEGIVFLASQSGRRIVPIAAAATRAWKPRGRWTDMLVPKPFSRVILRSGQPFSVPAAADRAEREVWRQRLQTMMDELNRETERLAGHDPNLAAEFVPAKAAKRRAA
jgi:lysophospholipid acyltransferase (LPLAT)-like uncharacterized protein